MKWRAIESAPKDREILLFGTDERGGESVSYGHFAIEYTHSWKEIVVSESEIHKVRESKPYERWVTWPELWPTHWLDIERPDTETGPPPV